MAQQQIIMLLLFVACAYVTQVSGMQTAWKHWGGDVRNSRYADITCLDTAKLKTGMKVKWMARTVGDAFAPPAVCNGFLYTVDYSGYAYKFNAANGGKPIWQTNFSKLPIKRALPSLKNLASRNTPILSPDCKFMYIGLQLTQGGWIAAFDTSNGKIVYYSQVDKHPLAKMQQSGVYHKGSLYLGIASMTEGTFTTPTFRGSVVKVNAANGKVQWQTMTCPVGYSGCGVWGSSPIIDAARNQVCVGTGNNYKVPAQVLQCRAAAGTNLKAQLACSAKGNYVDSLVCMDLTTGKVKWAKAWNGLDIWLPENRLGPDYDFAQNGILAKVGGRDLLIATSKSGRPLAVDPSNGRLVWGPLPQEFQGFSMFGSCSNGPVYCHGLYWFTKTQGAVVCLDSATGKRKWRWFLPDDEGVFGPLTCTKSAVFAPLMNKKGSLMAFDINTGRVLGQFDTGLPLFCGPTIVNGVAYFGTGYISNGGRPDNRLFALSLPLNGKC